MPSDDVSVDRWFAVIKLPLTIEQFERLPEHPDYKYEYFDGQAWLSPRPNSYHARLKLEPVVAETAVDAQRPIRIRPLDDADWPRLEKPFAAAFHRVQPFASLDDGQRREAARQLLRKSRAGGDGPLIAPACYVAADARDNRPVGANLITLQPDRDPTDWDAYHWREPPPADAIERRAGRPHLTWIFVAPRVTRYGVGTALLGHAVNRLLALGYAELTTTFLPGNHYSMLWHWRNGFALLENPSSMRKMQREIRAAWREDESTEER